MATEMTGAQLNEHIKTIIAPMLTDAFGGKQVAELIRENVAAAIKAAGGGTSYGAQLTGDVAEAKAKKMQKGAEFGAYVRALAAAKNDKDRAIGIARQWGYAGVADALKKSVEKALSSNDATAGGFLVPTEFSTDVIELLRASATIRSLNPMIMPMANGSVKVPKLTAGATASYIGENAAIGKSQQSTGQLTLTWKKLATLVPISNDLIRYASPNADIIVRNDCVRSMATREDYGFLRDDGTSGTPKGLKHWIHPDNKFNANSSQSLANVTNDLGHLVRCVMDANIALVVGQATEDAITAEPGWVFSPRTWQYLFTVQTGLGTYAFRDEMVRGTLWGWPFRVTTQIPITMSSTSVDTGGTYSEIYFGAFAHAVIGDALGINVDASGEAAYVENGTVVAAYAQDQTVIRVIAEHDFALRHDKAFAMAEQSVYGV